MLDSGIDFREKLESIFSYSSFIKYLQLEGSKEDILELEKIEAERRLSEGLDRLRNCQKWYYFNILDELILKGFEISDSYEVKVSGSNTFYIRVGEDIGRYKEIQWSRLGLEDVGEYFDVSSDYFFNYLEPERFIDYNEELSSEEVRDFFKEYGFDIEEKDLEVGKAPEKSGKTQEREEGIESSLGRPQEEKTLYGEEEVLLERQILQMDKVFADRGYLQEKYKADLSKYLKDKLILTEDRVAHIDRINISLSEEVDLISGKNELHEMDFPALEERYPEIIRRNPEIDSKEKIVSIIEILER
jgi:hypothetical protein